MEKIAEIKGVELHYDATGPENAPAVILMHGWGCNSFTVRMIAETLEDKFHVYNLDLPGHGASTEPENVWGTQDFASMLHEFILENKLSDVTVIGHSFGGRISILAASQISEISKIVLIDAAGIKSKLGFSKTLKIKVFKTLKKALPIIMGKKNGERYIERLRRKMGSADYRNSSPKMRAIMSKCVNEDLKTVMPAIKSPTLLVWGDQDTATPLSDAKTMEKLIPNAGLVSFPGSGHYSFLDQPLNFRKVLRNFMLKE